MRAYELALAVVCISFGLSIMNSVGLFPTMDTPDLGVDMNAPPVPASQVQLSSTDNMVSLNSTMESSTRISDQFFGFGLILSGLSVLKDTLGYNFLPAFYLYQHQVPVSICIAIQFLFNLVDTMGILQFLSGRGMVIMR